MQTEFIKLAVIFIVIMVMVLAKLKLRDAMIAAILLTVILFGIPLGDAAKLMIQSVYEKDTLLVVGSFILVTFLQRIMENRKLLERAGRCSPSGCRRILRMRRERTRRTTPCFCRYASCRGRRTSSGCRECGIRRRPGPPPSAPSRFCLRLQCRLRSHGR